MAQTRSVDPFNLDLSADETENCPPIAAWDYQWPAHRSGAGAGGGGWRHGASANCRVRLHAVVAGPGTDDIPGGFVGWLTSRIALTLAAAVRGPDRGAGHPDHGLYALLWPQSSWPGGRLALQRPGRLPYVLEGSSTGLVPGGLLIIPGPGGAGVAAELPLWRISPQKLTTRADWSRRGWVSLLVPLPLVF